MKKKSSVWLLITGDRSNGGEWYVLSIHSTPDGAEKAKRGAEITKKGRFGIYTLQAQIEKWDVEP